MKQMKSFQCSGETGRWAPRRLVVWLAGLALLVAAAGTAGAQTAVPAHDASHFSF